MKRIHYILLLCALWSLTLTAQTKTTRIQQSITTITDVLRQLDVNYVDTLNYETLTEEAINRMLAKIDPYTVYIPKKEDDNLRIMTTGMYGGIGALIMQRDSNIYVSEPYAGMPAQRNDVRAGDRIIRVDSMECYGKTNREVSDRLRGEPGTTVTLLIEREGEPQPIEKILKRQEIHIPPVTFYTTLNEPYGTEEDGKIGYVLFSEFTSGSAVALMNAIDAMIKRDHIDRLVLDLRNNGGGIIDEAIQIVGFFVDKDTEVVTTKGKTNASNRSYRTIMPPIYKDMPLVVLVNGQSASAAEIVSGSLQDLKRATIIGQRTYGKGLVQSIRPVAYDGHLKVTTAHYYLPSGRCIQAIDYSQRQKGNELKKDSTGGILPDIVITDSQKVDITYTLYRKHLSFDYATRYRSLHPSIAEPKHFTVTDDDLNDFVAFLQQKEFTYETETSRYYKDVLKMAHEEDIESATIAMMDTVLQRLRPSFKHTIMNRSQEVKQLLGAEIVTRYYFQEGRVAYMLRDDKELKRAIEVIRNM